LKRLFGSNRAFVEMSEFDRTSARQTRRRPKIKASFCAKDVNDAKIALNSALIRQKWIADGRRSKIDRISRQWARTTAFFDLLDSKVVIDPNKPLFRSN